MEATEKLLLPTDSPHMNNLEWESLGVARCNGFDSLGLKKRPVVLARRARTASWFDVVLTSFLLLAQVVVRSTLFFFRTMEHPTTRRPNTQFAGNGENEKGRKKWGQKTNPQSVRSCH